ncbi:MAG: ZIP family metal transporter, partial [Bacteroidota bacterium]
LLEQLSGGVEHGHVHAPHDNRGRFAMQVMIGLCLHAFMEGLPLGGTYEQLQHVHDHHHHGHHHLLLGIILHKAPAAFALVLLFSLSGFGKGRIVGALLLFALMSPLGAGLATYFNSRGWLAVTDQTIIVAIVIGSFLHIATTILFETDNSQQHRIPLRKLFSIVVGIGLAILTVLL